MSGLGLCPLGGLVCDLLLRGCRGLLPECALPEEYLGHNLDEYCLEDTWVLWCFTNFSGGAPFLWCYVSCQAW